MVPASHAVKPREALAIGAQRGEVSPQMARDSREAKTCQSPANNHDKRTGVTGILLGLVLKGLWGRDYICGREHCWHLGTQETSELALSWCRDSVGFSAQVTKSTKTSCSLERLCEWLLLWEDAEGLPAPCRTVSLRKKQPVGPGQTVNSRLAAFFIAWPKAPALCKGFLWATFVSHKLYFTASFFHYGIKCCLWKVMQIWFASRNSFRRQKQPCQQRAIL